MHIVAMPDDAPAPRPVGPGDHVFLVDGSSFVFRAYFQSINQDAKYNYRSDGLPTGAGLSQCFIGGILSHFVTPGIGDSIVTINTTTGQLGFTNDSAAGKIAEQQRKIEEQQASINQLKIEMQTMVAQLKEQAAQIQKVSAQLEVSKSAPQVVVNKP